MFLFQFVFMILLQHFIGSKCDAIVETTKLHHLMCPWTKNGIGNRSSEIWQKIANFENNKMPKQILSDFDEWKFRYESVERLFIYCEYLEKCISDPNLIECNQNDEAKSLKHLAIVPKFINANQKQLTIREAIKKIITAFKIFFMNKNARILHKCAKACVNKKQFPRMVFENKDECNKVKEWASQLESGDAQSKENALMNLRNTKEQLMLHSIAETQFTSEQKQNANESVGATSDKSVADNRSISHKKGGLFGCFGGQNGNDSHYHHGTAGRDRSRERDEHNAALYGAAIVGYGIGAAGCGGAGCGGGCGAR